MRKTKLLLLVVVVQSPEVIQSVELEKLEDVRKWMENIQ